MVPIDVQNELLDIFKELSPKNKNRLLEMARQLRKDSKKGATTEDYSWSHKPMDTEAIDEMSRIIEENHKWLMRP
jgi:hypothetical protein